MISFVRKFSFWKQGDEDDTWAGKAYDTLFKKLKRDDQHQTLLAVLRSKREDSPCITLSRSQDGRLQVAHRKMLPQVIYCRIFRWPDLQSQHELRSLSTCQWPAHRREQSKVCVNPYHYERVDHSLFPPVVTPRHGNQFTTASPSPHSPFSMDSNFSQQQSPPYMPQQQEPQYNHFGSPQQLQIPNQPLSLTYYTNQSPLPAYSSHGQPNGGASPMEITYHETRPTNNITDELKGAWCSISYSELNQKVGNPFKSNARVITVDGFFDTVDPTRFCLGLISNINRNKPIEQTRNAIGKGIRLENDGVQVHVTNQSDHAIFFQSKNCNVENQLQHHTVVKIHPGTKQKIFDRRIFENLLQDTLRSTDETTYKRLVDLSEHFSIRLSFVKGWGSTYSRQDVTSTPCWIEIHLLEYFLMLNEHLEKFKHPLQITSTS